MKRSRHRNLPGFGTASKDKQRALPAKIFSPVRLAGITQTCQAESAFCLLCGSEIFFFLERNVLSSTDWVLELTLVLVLVLRLFHLMLSGISALCCSQQCWHIHTHWNLLTSGCLSACVRSPVTLRPCTSVSLARFSACCLKGPSAFFSPRAVDHGIGQLVSYCLPELERAFLHPCLTYL